MEIYVNLIFTLENVPVHKREDIPMVFSVNSVNNFHFVFYSLLADICYIVERIMKEMSVTKLYSQMVIRRQNKHNSS